MHCARLGCPCLDELLSTRNLNLPIEGEAAEWLRAVRHSEVPFDESWALSLDLDAQLEAAMSDPSVPGGPDREWIPLEWSTSPADVGLGALAVTIDGRATTGRSRTLS